MLPKFIEYKPGFTNSLPNRNCFINKAAPNKVDGYQAFLPTIVLERNLKNPLDPYAPTSYAVVLMGVLPSGERVNVQIVGIQPYFEIHLRGADEKNVADHTKAIRKIIEQQQRTTPLRYSKFYAKPFKGYQRHKSVYLRMYFATADSRRQAIELVRRHGYETATDDKSNYFRVVSRDHHVQFSKWMLLKEHNECTNPALKGRTFVCHMRSIANYKGPLLPFMKMERTCSACWDIETYGTKLGLLPRYTNKDEYIFCMSQTFQWTTDAKPFARFCIVDRPAALSKEYTTVFCRKESDMFLAFAELMGYYSPELVFGFNDSDYDWPWLVNRAAETPGILASMASLMSTVVPYRAMSDKEVLGPFNYKEEKVKLEAGINVCGKSLALPGYITADVRTIFRSMDPKSDKSSLAYFLEKNKLGNKYDMSIDTMFKTVNAYTAFVTKHPEYIDRAIANYAALPIAVHESLAHEIEQDTKPVVDFRDIDRPAIDDTVDELGEQMGDADEHDQNAEHDQQTDIMQQINAADDQFYPPDCRTADQQYAYLMQQMAEINLYCVIDAQKCHELLRKRNIIMERRELAAMSYTAVYDAIYRANGMKVRNLAISFAQTTMFGCRCSNIQRDEDEIEEGKYPGAFVFPPKKGLYASKLTPADRKLRAAELQREPQLQEYCSSDLEWLNVTDEEIKRAEQFIEDKGRVVFDHKEIPEDFSPSVRRFLEEPIGRPITGLDFSSLYPSLMRAYNFSPEYFVQDPKLAAELQAEGQRLTHVEFDFDGRRCEGWFVWHNNKLKPDEPGFQFGIYPYILDWLFKERDAVKKPFKALEKKIAAFKKRIADGYKPSSDELVAIEEDEFEAACLDAKQKAIKVFMNTFYGEAGNKRSPFFLVEVAGGITTYGVRNIKMAFDRVRQQGCQVFYGDTDSLYISMPERIFADIDILHYTGRMTRKEYWNEMVARTMREIDIVKLDVNQMFIDDNHTAFLSMAYEEVLYPLVLTGKKKYYGIPHIAVVNFDIAAEDLFIRGLDVVKRGNSPLAKDACMDIMCKAVDYNNHLSILELVIKKIAEIYQTKWPLDKFARSERLSIERKNIRHRRFYERMQQRDYLHIKPGERFTYVYVQTYPYVYDHRGRKQDIKAGDRMEPFDWAKTHDMAVDLDYYFKSQIDGQLARLITYHPMFNTEPVEESYEAQKRAEVQLQKAACRFVLELRKPHIVKYNTVGRAYQTVARRANNTVIEKLQASGMDRCTVSLVYQAKEFNTVREYLMQRAASEAEHAAEGYGKQFVERYLRMRAAVIGRHMKDNPKLLGRHKTLRSYCLEELYQTYCGKRGQCISDKREVMHRQIMDNLMVSLENQMGSIGALFVQAAKTQARILKNVSEAVIKPEWLAPTESARQIELDEMDQTEINRCIEQYCAEEVERQNSAEYKRAAKTLRTIYYSIVSANKMIYHTRSTTAYIKACRMASAGIDVQPINIGKIKEQMLNELMKGDI